MQLRVGALSADAPKGLASAGQPYSYLMVQRGAQRVTTELHRPNVNEAVSTTKVVVEMLSGGEVIAEKTVEQRIDWPTFQTWAMNVQEANRTPKQSFERAVKLIDAGDSTSLEEARSLLERRLRQDPKFEPAYVELARVAMKTNWGPEGLRQAERHRLVEPGDARRYLRLDVAVADSRPGSFSSATLLSHMGRSQ